MSTRAKCSSLSVKTRTARESRNFFELHEVSTFDVDANAGAGRNGGGGEGGGNGKKIRLIIPGSITDLMIPTARPQRDDHVVKEEPRVE